jgi:hypothetical protein
VARVETEHNVARYVRKSEFTAEAQRTEVQEFRRQEFRSSGPAHGELLPVSAVAIRRDRYRGLLLLGDFN